jgi:hypothetical protein
MNVLGETWPQDESPRKELPREKVLVGKYLSCGAFVDLDTARETMPAHV